MGGGESPWEVAFWALQTLGLNPLLPLQQLLWLVSPSPQLLCLRELSPEPWRVDGATGGAGPCPETGPCAWRCPEVGVAASLGEMRF